jgi:CMP-N-acetylneuraminic acid synthetase
MLNGIWNATDFFGNLTATNKLAQSENFVFCRVSGLEGFEEALHQLQTASAIVAVSDIANGYTELNNTPKTRRVKTVFFAMRHPLDDMDARAECMETMRELFRQFMSVLILERVKLEQNCIYLDPRITFTEIDSYFFSGCACAYFQVAVDVFTDLRYNEEEWNG